ncbi:MAG TPA: hypothetical protein VNM37_29470, partial [Candidatus Dormibacteraeota bacterium]|nr:hypothetical protein [Candidatus Dormibacteraeota bacterium]
MGTRTGAAPALIGKGGGRTGPGRAVGGATPGRTGGTAASSGGATPNNARCSLIGTHFTQDRTNVPTSTGDIVSAAAWTS